MDCNIHLNSIIHIALFIKGWVVIPLSIGLTSMAYFRIIKSHQLEIISSVLSVPSSGWFWYVTTNYFNKENNWKHKAKPLFFIHTILTIEALWFFFKLMMIVLLLSLILLFMFCDNYLNWRRQRSHTLSIKDKIMTRESLHLLPSQIDPDEFWVIWMEQYTEKDKVIRLPWTKTHFFHSKCLEEWITISPKCPLCNTEIDPDMKKN